MDMFGNLLVLSLIGLGYSRPEFSDVTPHHLVPDERCHVVGHRLLPHEYDCTKFYYCEHGMKHAEPRQCPPGTEFCFDVSVCVHRTLANCPLPGPPSTPCPGCPPETTTTTPEPTTTTPQPTTTTTPEPTTTTTTPQPTTTTTEAPTPAPCPTCPPCPDCPVCPEVDPCETECHVPHWSHDTDCDKFWRCEGSKKALGVCSEGLLFNPKTKTCDFSCKVDCVRRTIQTTVQRDGIKIFMPWNKVDDLVMMSMLDERPDMEIIDLIKQHKE